MTILRRDDMISSSLEDYLEAIAEIAERVGYGSASTFSTAFSRHVGQPPGRYARGLAERTAATERPISPRSRARTGRGRR